MRCPKCGYISFDHLEVCEKCKKNIKAVSDTLRGSVFAVQAPAFLQLQPRQSAEEAEDIVVADSEEYVDDDLAILIEEPQESDREIEFRQEGSPELTVESAGDSAQNEEEEREIEVNFAEFGDASNAGASPVDEELTFDAREEKSFTLEMPEALTDISDLAPPAKTVAVDSEPSPVARKSAVNLDEDLDFNLGLDDLDLPPVTGSPAEAELSLDDLDFSDTLVQAPPKPTGKAATDMDEELNFELDLGGLSLHKDL